MFPDRCPFTRLDSFVRGTVWTPALGSTMLLVGQAQILRADKLARPLQVHAYGQDDNGGHDCGTYQRERQEFKQARGCQAKSEGLWQRQS